MIQYNFKSIIQKFLVYLFASCGFLGIILIGCYGVAAGKAAQRVMSYSSPQLVSCDIKDVIFVERAMDHEWPVGKLHGCRCLLLWKGRLYISYENEKRIMCTDRE